MWNTLGGNRRKDIIFDGTDLFIVTVSSTLSFVFMVTIITTTFIITSSSSSSYTVEAFHISNVNTLIHSKSCYECRLQLTSSSSPSTILQSWSQDHQRYRNHPVPHTMRRNGYSRSNYLFPRSSTPSSSTRLYMFDQLTSAITDAVSTFAGGKKRLTENNISGALQSVRRALLDADVNIGVTDTLIDGVRRRTVGQELRKGITPDQQFIKAMYDELVDMMGGSSVSGSSSGAMPASTVAVGSIANPAIILLAGLQGAGKTTVAGKLALFMKEREVMYDDIDTTTTTTNNNMDTKLASRLPKRQRQVLLIAADIYRPAAIQQLQVLGERIGVDVYALGTDINPVQIVQRGLQYAKEQKKYDAIIIDTAGRQFIDQTLMKELKDIKKVSSASETLLVVDAMTGQEAATLTASFDNAVGLTGAILTKMDGDIRGGAAVSVRGVSGKPIKFIGIGEKMIDLEPFYPDRMASRILGMGDIISLVEKASAEVSDDDAMQLQKKMLDASFDFQDFLQQSELVSKMGNIGQIAKMIPGLGGQISNQQIKEVEIRLKKNKALINSMTIKERRNPDLLIIDRTARSRLQRITRGAGLSLQAGQQFITEFQKMRTLMSRMQKQMGGGGGGLDPAMASGDDAAAVLAASGGNRASRRASKKNAKKGSGRGFGGGFA